MRNLYRMEHDVTKEVHEGTAVELAAILGVTSNMICKKALEYGFVAKHWRIKKIGKTPPKRMLDKTVKQAEGTEKPLQVVNAPVKREKCLCCGNFIPVGKNSYFCNTQCGNKYRQREYNERMKEEYKIRVGKTKARVKPKYSIAEIAARARAAGMTYGQYVSVNGL